jgi:GTP-binding protein
VRITAEFVTSAAGAAGLPVDRLPEIALVGRSNVGKSSLINALTRTHIARTSAAPGKTRLANIYRVQRGAGAPLYLVDLPGYGYARGGTAAVREFEELTAAYFGIRLKADTTHSSGDSRSVRLQPDHPGARQPAAILLVDARHPGLDSDISAWHWLKETVANAAVVATKIDKLARGERIRAMRELESVHEDSVLPVSAVTGEGLDELWKLMDRLANSQNPQPRPASRLPNNSLARATAPPRPTLRQAPGRPEQSRGASQVAGPKKARPLRKR